MDGIFSFDEIVSGESFALSFTAPAGATAAEIVFSGLTTSTHFTLEEGRFVANVTSATTLAMSTAQRYAVFVTATDGKRCIERGEFSVVRVTSRYRDVLAAVEASIASWGSNPNQTINVGEINISYKTLDDLLALRSYYKGLVDEEESGGSSSSSGPFIIGTRFC